MERMRKRGGFQVCWHSHKTETRPNRTSEDDNISLRDVNHGAIADLSSAPICSTHGPWPAICIHIFSAHPDSASPESPHNNNSYDICDGLTGEQKLGSRLRWHEIHRESLYSVLRLQYLGSSVADCVLSKTRLREPR
jgi:hypothetical protein